ncbi:hypothetical protein GCM10009841_32660 [Microlunatus panaciterrae]|uniref:Anti-sigma-YlaC factor YlaD n=1 Tax=Microlunatus panaciterrae TaxID=400768 RepID=A0ABS2RFZ4_9ACTN|nr:putative anti-sigma-YlaC factor YlaD [Microlunatus panaciterrae]
MKGKSCSNLAELRSAYVDGALSPADEQLLLRHLSDCAGCRAEVAEIRQLREMLNRAGASTREPSPPDLSHRLVSIAGQDAAAPLWSRPFRRTRPGALPSTRRALRRRITTVVAVVGSMVATTAGVGYAAAPPLELPAVADPSAGARAEFATMLAQLPLANDAVNAVMMVTGSSLESAADGAWPRPAPATGARLDDRANLALLERAVGAATTVGYAGMQQVTVPRTGHTISARVRATFQPGQGTQLAVSNSKGRRLVEGFVPAPATSRVVNRDLLTLLLERYPLTGVAGAEVAGRSATMLEAVDPATRVVRARWWIDDHSGLLLWQESYDASGALIRAAGFTSVRVSNDEGFMEHLAPRLAVPTTTATLTLSSAGELASQGWFCRDELAGLSLVRLRSGGDADPSGVLHMVYSDGLSTISVFEVRGALTAAPAGSSWDPTLAAYISDGLPRMATWQSGATVFTVVSDGPAALRRSAVRSLPHQPALSRTTMDRVQAGWSRIFDLANG